MGLLNTLIPEGFENMIPNAFIPGRAGIVCYSHPITSFSTSGEEEAVNGPFVARIARFRNQDNRPIVPIVLVAISV
jgi:hypothetical protein